MSKTEQIKDFRELTCTNLMLKLKILVEKMPKSTSLVFLSTREQKDNVKKPFSKKGTTFEATKLDENKFQISIVKIK